MTLFWTLAAILTVAALLFLLLPMLMSRPAPGGRASTDVLDAKVSVYRSQLADLEADREAGTISEEQFNTARTDLQRSLLEASEGRTAAPAGAIKGSWRLPTGIASLLVVPVLAVLIYQGYGAGEPGLDPQRPSSQTAQAGMDQNMEAAVSALAARLESNPDDPDGWALLGRSLLFLDQPRAAAGAYAQAIRYGGNRDPDILVTYADLLGSLDGGDLNARALPFVTQALEIEPDHTNALWLAGLAAFRAADYETTKGYWERLESQLTPGSEEIQLIRSNLAEVRSRLNNGAESDNSTPSEAPPQ
nr:c-type cytochrome biogenesis protein CcmI [Thioalkalivibrio sp.]